MKAGYLFMQCIKNYKSLLQSYSLKTMIEALGHEAGLVDMRKGDMSKPPLVSVGSLGKTRAGEGIANCRFKLRGKSLSAALSMPFGMMCLVGALRAMWSIPVSMRFSI